jgi:hypothetical protein
MFKITTKLSMLHPSVDMKHSEFQQNNEREIQIFGETSKRKAIHRVKN